MYEANTPMDFAKELSSHAYLFLKSIEEPGEGVLRLMIEVGVASAEAKEIVIGDNVLSGSHQISADESTPEYEMVFAHAALPKSHSW